MSVNVTLRTTSHYEVQFLVVSDTYQLVSASCSVIYPRLRRRGTAHALLHHMRLDRDCVNKPQTPGGGTEVKQIALSIKS